MTIVGDVLKYPETGWIRIKASNPKFLYNEDWSTLNTDYGVLHEGVRYRQSTTKLDASVSFVFFGNKLRIISTYSKSHSRKIDINIDGNIESFAINVTDTAGGILAYEKELAEGIHHVTITNKDDGVFCILDCFDINSGGYFMQYQETVLNKKIKIEDMKIGDIIPCRYANLKNDAIGAFSELGVCEMDLIPRYSNSIVDGKFYFIKVDENKLIADRNLQSGISWNTLNNNKIIDGTACWYNKTAFKFEKSDSFIWVLNSKVKSIEDKLALKIRIYKEDWSKGKVSGSEGERLFSSTNRGGMGLFFFSNSKTIKFVSYIGGSYVGPTASIGDIMTGWIDVHVTYNSSTIDIYINGVLKDSYKTSGKVNHGDPNWLCIGAEPGDGSSIEASYYPSLSNAKISHFSLFDKAITPSDYPSDVTGIEDGLLLWLDAKNSTNEVVLDKSKNKNHGTIVGCTSEYEQNFDILTIPTGGVAYNGENIEQQNKVIYDKPYTTHQNHGGWPICNDWDRYICNSSLGSKIIPSDNDIWNYKKTATACRERIIPDMKDISDSVPSLQTNNILVTTRGFVDDKIDDTTAKRMNIAPSNLCTSERGFRPMIILGGAING